MSQRRSTLVRVALLSVLVLFGTSCLHAQDDAAPVKHGRKYKAPPQTARIEVTVIKGFNKKPIMNAAVIFHPIDANGHDDGTLEVKSGPDGKASIDIIPLNSKVRVQVLANGFATYAEDFNIDSLNREILVSMVRPQAQVSAYQDNGGKAADTQPGIQEPVRPKKSSGTSSSSGSSTTPPDTTGSSKPQL